MKVWITKYALTDGITESEGEIHSSYPQIFQIRGGQQVLGRDWHSTRESAVARATQMRDDKIKSLRAQIARLEAIKFEKGQS